MPEPSLASCKAFCFIVSDKSSVLACSGPSKKWATHLSVKYSLVIQLIFFVFYRFVKVSFQSILSHNSKSDRPQSGDSQMFFLFLGAFNLFVVKHFKLHFM